MRGKKHRTCRRARLAAVALAWLVPAAGYAVTMPYDGGIIGFSTSDQSMWGPGEAFILDETRFLGTEWNTGRTSLGVGVTGSKDFCAVPTPIGCGVPRVDTRTGYEADVKTSGKAGFEVGAKLDSGSVNASVTYNPTAAIPHAPKIGDFFNLNPESLLTDGTLNTNLAEASGRVDAIFGVKGEFRGRVCFIGFGCSPDTGLASDTVGFDPKSLELLSFNDEDSPGEIKILDVADPALFNFGSPISVPNPANPLGEVGNVTIHVPDINTFDDLADGVLASHGMDDFLDLRVDIDGLILGAFGLPGLGISLNAGIFDVSGDLIDIEIGPTIELLQDFELEPTLMVDLEFDRPVMVAGETDPVTSWTAPWDAIPDIALLGDTLVTPTFWLDAMLRNITGLGADGVFTLDALKASLALSAFGLSVDVGDVGPLFELPVRGDLFDTPPLFDETFGLLGFDRVAGLPFLIKVPEPATLALLGLALLALAASAARRRRR